MMREKEGQSINGRKIEKNKKVIKMVLLAVIVMILLVIVALVVNNYIILGKYKKTNLIINNRNVTKDLKKEVLIQDDEIYISKQDIGNFFDKHIYEEKETGKIITTYNKKIAELGFEKNKININGSEKTTYAHAIKKDDTIYLPIQELKDVYDVEIIYNQKAKALILDSTSKEQKKAVGRKSLAVKSSTRFIAKTVDRIKKGEVVVVISENKGFSKIRTENGKIGYVKTKNLANQIMVRENMEEEKQIKGKVNLVWDYYSKVATAPNRNGTQIDGVNVVSPAFFHLNENGKLVGNIGEEGIEYIKWAKENNYKIWPMVQNDGEGMLNVTSKLMNSYEKRKELIESLVNVCIKYKLDGINVDFENMKKEDKDLYSRFIVELAPRMKELGLVLSVDVTAPDGGDTWSLCFDRHVIGDVADYIVFMAYDEYGVASKHSGTTAGYDWVELGINKFLQTEEIKSEKIILAVPLYTRLWTENSQGDVIKRTVVAMKDINKVLPEGVQKKWDDKLKQDYVEFEQDGNKKKMWIEDEKSLEAKTSLIEKYNLGGIAAWEKGMEADNVWTIFKNALK